MATTVPSYKDISKQANDLLGKDFPVGIAKLDVKSVTPSNVQFNVCGNQSADGVIFGNLEAKYADKPNGLTLTQGWDTRNVLNTKIEIQDQIARGVKAELCTRFCPDSAKNKNAAVTLTYKNLNLNSTALIDILRRSFTGDVCVGHDGFLAGAQVKYDIAKGSISDYAATIGYQALPYTVTVQALSNFSVFSASYHHKVNQLVEASGKVSWDAKVAANAVSLEIGSKYALDPSSYVKGKINNAGIANLSYFQKVRPGVKLGLGMQLDTQRIAEPTYKMGLALNFEG